VVGRGSRLRPCEPDAARGNRGGVGSLALPAQIAPLPRKAGRALAHYQSERQV